MGDASWAPPAHGDGMARGLVLIVEDDARMAAAIGRNLTARGYTVILAATIAEAGAALGRARPTVILLDIDLPDGSGWEVPRALRLAGQEQPAVIVMSGLRPNARL